ncbi:MAG: transposase zinc-binding domain-containing protein, partial [Spirochaetales bacterium]|nr:transposase zinc-binding domain-containing protein [Spirochaetales bacterium]
MAALSCSAYKIGTTQHRYHPRQQNIIQQLFRERFARFEAVYEEQYADNFGKYRLPVIQHAADAFKLCGDWQEGVARIMCGDCGYDFFRPFSCKSFFLCPSCGQKRTLLLGEYDKISPKVDPLGKSYHESCSRALNALSARCAIS